MGGLFINLDSVPVGLVWLKAISMFRHSFEAPLLVSVIEFKVLTGAGFDDQPVARLRRPHMRWAVHRAKRRGGLGVERNQSRQRQLLPSSRAVALTPPRSQSTMSERFGHIRQPRLHGVNAVPPDSALQLVGCGFAEMPLSIPAKCLYKYVGCVPFFAKFLLLRLLSQLGILSANASGAPSTVRGCCPRR